MRKHATSSKNISVVVNQISQEFTLSDFKSDYTTMKSSSMYRFQKCKKINFEKLARFLIRSHTHTHTHIYICDRGCENWSFVK